MSRDTTPVIWLQLFNQLVFLAPITYLVRGLDVESGVTTAPRYRYHMVKLQLLVREDGLFANVAPHAVAFKNSLVIDFFHISQKLAGISSTRNLSKFLAVLVSPCFMLSLITLAILFPIAPGARVSLFALFNIRNFMAAFPTPRLKFIRGTFSWAKLTDILFLEASSTYLFAIGSRWKVFRYRMFSAICFVMFRFSTSLADCSQAVAITFFRLIKAIERLFSLASGAGFDRKQGELLSAVIYFSHDIHPPTRVIV